ncbi:MAG: OsmC family protein [Propionibacteriaceae bacterium]|nr:OsmC family protein [Propionibacteriaceae bacterium]
MTQPDPLPAVLPPPDGATVRAERVGPRTYAGRTSRGSSLLIGPDEVEGGFWPGELLKLALAGCTGMTADSALARRLGPDAPATVAVEGAKHAVEDRFVRFDEQLVVDLSGLGDAEKARLAAVVNQAVAKHCTIGLTVARSAEVNLSLPPAVA